MAEQPHPPELTETTPLTVSPAPLPAAPPRDAAPESRPPSPRPVRKPAADFPFWRFSIRELLLLTAAVAAFLAWAGLFYQRNKPYQRTKVPDEIGRLEVLLEISRELGHQTSTTSSGGSGMSDMYSTNRTFDISLDLPRELRGRFMEAYLEHVRKVLAEHATSSSGGGTTRDELGLRAFEFDYSSGSTRGSIYVRSMGGNGELSLFIFLHEHDSRRR
ncbi:MAG: hypothetical protein MUF06_16075 [Pirellulaceae bacterium]|jgi:hypothetical protein|nr:hypothetical protein [Pirellulaceae bacterium]